MSEKRPLDQIVVKDRHRREMGDIKSLAASIDKVGLLHPVVITESCRLVAGQRRMEACRSLGWKEIPVTVAGDLVDAYAMLCAERDENTCREEMRLSEKVSLGRVLEELERPKARERQEASRTKPGERVGAVNFTAPTLPRDGYTRDIVGAALGMSGVTYQRAKRVVVDSEDESLPKSAREVAVDARRQMDQTGKVQAAYLKVRAATDGTPGRRNGRPKRAPKSPEPYTPTTEREHQLANAQKRKLVSALSGIAGFCKGLGEIKLGVAFAALSPEERATWAREAQTHARSLSRMAKQLQPEVTHEQ